MANKMSTKQGRDSFKMCIVYLIPMLLKNVFLLNLNLVFEHFK